MNVLSFRLSPWYSSGMFVLIVVVLISVYIIVSDGISSLIAALFSSGTTLLIPYNNNSGGGYNGLLVALDIKPSACSLGGYSLSTYGLPI